ncbi:MAG: DUF5675 family protein [Candidatus Saccharicenans sp.]
MNIELMTFRGLMLKFSGKEQDTESGLYYFGARYYDPTLYRLLSPDPVIPTDKALYNAQRWNLYGYCLGNPVNFIDPFGDIVIEIYRTKYTGYATYGVYRIELGDTVLTGYTMEPAVGQGKGPIPIGDYKADFYFSPNKKYVVIELKDVTNFEHVQIHIGNFPADTKGCILVGEGVNSSGNLTGSREAFNEMMGHIFDYVISTVNDAINNGWFDLDLLHWLFEKEVIIRNVPIGIVTCEVTNIRPAPAY